MFCSKREVTFILSVVLLVACYDEEVMISDLQGCRELLLNDTSINSFELSTLAYKKPRHSYEMFRIKFFVLGHDTHVRLSHTGNFKEVHYLAYFHGNGGAGSYKSAIAETDARYNSWKILEEAVETIVTDRFYFTTLYLSISNHGLIQVFTKNGLLMSTTVSEYFPPTFIAFSKSPFEDSSRVFFDCPQDPSHEEYEFSTETSSSTISLFDEIDEQETEKWEDSFKSEAASLLLGRSLIWLTFHALVVFNIF